MKKLLILVPKDSLLNTYLNKSFRVYVQVAEIDDVVYYKFIGLSNSMETISYLVTMFMLSDFSIYCNNGDYTFRVCS